MLDIGVALTVVVVDDAGIDAVKPGDRVVILDDLLATGGTMAASVDLLQEVGAEVAGAACIIELRFLEGRNKLDVPVETLIQYDS